MTSNQEYALLLLREASLRAPHVREHDDGRVVVTHTVPNRVGNPIRVRSTLAPDGSVTGWTDA